MKTKQQLSSVLLCIIFLPVCRGDGCPDGWFYPKQRGSRLCYSPFNLFTNGSAAAKTCEDLNSYLLMPKTKEQRESRQNQNLWIGLHVSKSTNITDFRWFDGMPVEPDIPYRPESYGDPNSTCVLNLALRWTPVECHSVKALVKCQVCEIGTWGPDCVDCSSHCTTAECDPRNGSCPVCHAGYWDERCSSRCPEHCAKCDKDIGCSGCQLGYILKGETCESESTTTPNSSASVCQAGYWGERCTSKCPEHCVNCTKDIGCTKCQNGYVLKGGICESSSDKKSNLSASVCQAGYWGERCTSKCPEHCAKCDKDIGCSGCQKGYVLKGGTCESSSGKKSNSTTSGTAPKGEEEEEISDKSASSTDSTISKGAVVAAAAGVVGVAGVGIAAAAGLLPGTGTAGGGKAGAGAAPPPGKMAPPGKIKPADFAISFPVKKRKKEEEEEMAEEEQSKYMESSLGPTTEHSTEYSTVTSISDMSDRSDISDISDLSSAG